MTAPVQQLLLLLLCVTHLSCISEVAAANTGDLWSRIHHVIGSGRGTLLPQTAQRRQQSNGISSASSQRPTISTGSGPAPADRDKKFDLALWKWLKDGGTKLAFAPGYSASGVRGGYATEDIPAGGVVRSCVRYKLATDRMSVILHLHDVGQQRYSFTSCVRITVLHARTWVATGSHEQSSWPSDNIVLSGHNPIACVLLQGPL